jgi:hypothetical protein
MTDEVLRVLETIVMLSLVILTGLFLRRRKLLDKPSTERISRFVADVAFPALVFTSMLRSVDPQSMAESWYLPLMGVLLLLAGMGIGSLAARCARGADAATRGSAAFAVGTPNWLFVPLPIAIALYSEQGERIVLLVNVGALLIFWSVGVSVVRGTRPDAASLRGLVVNPGLLATVLAVAAALAFPAARTVERLDITEVGIGLGAMSVVVQAMAFLGDVTVPLAMVVTGSMLGDEDAEGLWSARITGLVAIRLVGFPVLVMLLLLLARTIGLHVETATATTLIIISAMPVAVTCSVVAEKYGGDVSLVSRAIFLSTMASVVTVPAIVWLGRILAL